MVIKFTVWGTSCRMTINLDEICKLEGKRGYPKTKRRKLFRMIIDNMEQAELDDIEQYLADNTKTFAAEFSELRRGR